MFGQFAMAPAVQLVRRHETAVASGVLLRTAWAAGGRRKTFHYSHPRCTPPCHLALAVGAPSQLLLILTSSLEATPLLSNDA